MIIHNCTQYSPEWWQVRRGIPTASCADKIITPTGKLSSQSRQYMNELLAESLGFQDEPMEPTAWMLRGLELEPEARALYELLTETEVEQVGFVTNDAGTAGASPDGLLSWAGFDAGWECKCPKASTHIGYLLGGSLPDYYKPQVHFSMAVTGFKRWIFMSHYPGLDPLIVTVIRDEYTETIAKAIEGFVQQLSEARCKLRQAA